MADATVRYGVELAADVDTDITGGGIPEGKAGTLYLKLSNTTDAEVAVAPIRKTTGGAPTPADVIHPGFTIEPGGWWLDERIKMGDGYQLFLHADGPLAVEFCGRAEG